MRPVSMVALGLVLAHAAAVAALHWPEWWLSLLALLCWGFAAVGAGELRPTTSPRHLDVRAAERTALGRELMHREAWIVERPVVALALFIALSMLAATVAVALTPAEETPLGLARAYVWAPAAVPAAGFVVSGMVNMWLVTGPLLVFWLLFLIIGVASGEWDIVLRLVGTAAGIVGALFCIDLLRGARRGLEREPPGAAE